jgi:bifunctional oligoribonuclease and PAP phosphatase NrnA
MMQNLEAFKELISSPKNIIIIPHHKPDADALGSCLGLAGFLKKKNHDVKVISPSDYPNFLKWMAGNEEVIIFSEGNQKKSQDLIYNADIICCLDYSSLARINEMEDIVRNAKAIKVNIDHHLDPEDFADYVLWDTSAAATAELVFDLIEALGEKNIIDIDVAECLYAGIMTDTGSFKHPNTTKKVHMVTSELIDIGADNGKVSKLIYDNNTLNRMKFIGFALSEKLVVLPEFRTAYFAISASELERFQSQTGDTEGLVNYALAIENIVLAAVILDRKDGIKISFRSVGDFAVNEFARQHFHGGGHKNASGGKSDKNLQDTVNYFTGLLPIYKDQLINANQKLKENV